MRKLLAPIASILLFLAGLLSLAQVPDIGRVKAASHGAIPSIPSYANANNHILFFEQFNSTANIDLTKTKAAGKNWYLTSPETFPTSLCGMGTTNPDAAWFTTLQSTLTISTNIASPAACWSQEMVSYAYTGTNTTIQNYTIPGSGGFYVEGSFKWTPNCAQVFIPDFWLQSRLGSIAQIQQSGAFRFGELDVFEGCGTNQTVQTIVDWSNYNTNSFARSDADLTGINYSVYHTWGALLTTMAQGGGTGSVKWYVDRVQTGNAITWTSASDFAAILEADSFIINMGTGNGTAFSVKYVMVAVPHHLEDKDWGWLLAHDNDNNAFEWRQAM